MKAQKCYRSRVSVIVAIYNVEQYLTKCLDSLKEQSYSDVEFILVDDGSTDNSGMIADRYSDSRFHVFHTANKGLSAARNYGIEKAHGEWIMFVDGDDWVSPDFCETPEYSLAVKPPFQNAEYRRSRIGVPLSCRFIRYRSA